MLVTYKDKDFSELTIKTFRDRKKTSEEQVNEFISNLDGKYIVDIKKETIRTISGEEEKITLIYGTVVPRKQKYVLDEDDNFVKDRD